MKTWLVSVPNLRRGPSLSGRSNPNPERCLDPEQFGDKSREGFRLRAWRPNQRYLIPESSRMTTVQATEIPLPPGRVRAHWHWMTVALLGVGLWIWAIAGCADEWRDNPMYSYGWFVPPLMVFFAWRRLDEPFATRTPFGEPQLPRHSIIIARTVAVFSLATLPVELLRNELPDDRLNNWGIALTAVTTTLWIAYCLGGRRLFLSLAFPIAFFLTAVAWPKRYETPVTVGLQKMVAVVIVEVMHLLGIHAEPHGTTIYLDNGPVGIAEACSGIRSLQASLMITLAIGELFYLKTLRRLGLVITCALVATLLSIWAEPSRCALSPNTREARRCTKPTIYRRRCPGRSFP